jgi:hypothetical protein
MPLQSTVSAFLQDLRIGSWQRRIESDSFPDHHSAITRIVAAFTRQHNSSPWRGLPACDSFEKKMAVWKLAHRDSHNRTL